MANTPNLGLPLIDSNMTADVPRDVNALANAVDAAVGNISAVPTTAKDAAGAIAELHGEINNNEAQITQTANSINNLAGAGRTTQTVKGNADELAAHKADKANPHVVTKSQVGLDSVPNYPASTQAQAEAGTDNATLMTPQRTKQYVDKRLLNNIIWRVGTSGPEYSTDGGTWKPMGDISLSNYFGQYGSFPFIGDATDIIVSANTTWSDTSGYKRVRKLTINSGITLNIGRSPFVIFADEINFGSTTSRINASGPSGSDGGTSLYDGVMFAKGGICAAGTSIMYSAAGCGGGLLFIIARKVSGASGQILANGGNGYVHPTNARGSVGVAGGMDAYGDRSCLLIGAGGSAGSDGSSTPRGGYGIGGGGTAHLNTVAPGQQAIVRPSAAQLFWLYQSGCMGGGGGGAWSGDNSTTSATYNRAGGGGGGAILLWAKELLVTPTLQANGGNSAGLVSSAGAAGVIHIITL